MRTTSQHKPRNTDAQLGLFSGHPGLSHKGLDRNTINRESIEVALGIVTAETWPPRYKAHKYWGRKPANVLERYIEYFTECGDLVVDPFCGSGVTLVEGSRLKRRAAGFDINPMAVSLTNATLNPPNPRDFDVAARAIVAEVELRLGWLYDTACDLCGGKATVRSVGYCGEAMHEVRYRCPKCSRSHAHRPTSEDVTLAQRVVPIGSEAPDGDIAFGWEMQKLKRRGVTRWSELFTHRNFAIATALRAEILKVEDRSCREWLLVSLTAGLAQFTRMIADSNGDAGGPSWKINCYWLPNRWQELNPIWYFENRVSKSLEAIRDLVANGAPYDGASVEVRDSREMPLEDSSVDYIFTDPPYGGEGIQYGELSMLWCLWMDQQEDLSREIAFNPYRQFDENHYASGLRKVFEECHRVLKPGRWMTVTFANKDPVVWDSLLDSCRSVGFSLVTAAPMKRSAPSLTETNMHTAPKSDLILTFTKPRHGKLAHHTTASGDEYSLSGAVMRIAHSLGSANPDFTVHDIYDRVTVDWFSWFYDKGQRPSAIQPSLAGVEETLKVMGGLSKRTINGAPGKGSAGHSLTE